MRTIQLIQNYDIDSGLVLTKMTTHRSSEFSNDPTGNSYLAGAGSMYGGSSINPFEAVKTKNYLNRRQTCNEQIAHWTRVLRHTEALMLIQAEAGSKTNIDDDRVSIITSKIVLCHIDPTC